MKARLPGFLMGAIENGDVASPLSTNTSTATAAKRAAHLTYARPTTGQLAA